MSTSLSDEDLLWNDIHNSVSKLKNQVSHIPHEETTLGINGKVKFTGKIYNNKDK